jgi:PhnB protein
VFKGLAFSGGSTPVSLQSLPAKKASSGHWDPLVDLAGAQTIKSQGRHHAGGSDGNRKGEVAMASVSTYLNFDGKTEEAFEFYKSVFGTEYIGGVIMRMSQAPPMEGMPAVTEEEKNLVMNVQLPITGGHLLMGNDVLEWFGDPLVTGTNMHINIHPDTREEADRLFAALGEGGTVTMAMQDQFWGDYFGSLIDKFGIQWMVAYSPPK